MKHLSIPAGLWPALLPGPLLAGLLLAGLFFPVPSLQAAPSFIYSSPRPEATLVSPATTVTVRYAQPVDPAAASAAAFRVRGAESGLHSGDVTLAGDGRTVIFTPHAPFARGERVTATIGDLRAAGGATLAGGDLTFTIASRPVPRDAIPATLRPGAAAANMAPPTRATPLPSTAPLDGLAGYVTAPATVPNIAVTSAANGAGDGYIFLANFVFDVGQRVGANYDPYLLIVDNQGEVVFYRDLGTTGFAYDFKKQPGGQLTYAQFESGHHVLDDTYTEVKTYTAGNGYLADTHDFQLHPDGRALLLIYDAQFVNMSRIVPGGNPNAIVVGLIVQEVDAANNVLFQWRSWDHIPITDTTVDLTEPIVDYVHGNSVEWDHDGNLIISSRSLDEVTKIDRQTGDVIWRLGGKANQFTFTGGGGEPFIEQHDARRLPNGNLTIYDNRSGADETYSRGVEYDLDEDAMIAHRVWEYRNTGGEASWGMGNMQRLPNGNSLIGWGGLNPTLTEVKPTGQKALEMVLGPVEDPSLLAMSYRAFRFPWEGRPTNRPQIVSRREMSETAVYYSWNGATNVATWRLHAGPARRNLRVVDTRPRDGFETRSVIADSDLCYFRVSALDAEGAVLRRSAIEIADHCIATRAYLPALSP